MLKGFITFLTVLVSLYGVANAYDFSVSNTVQLRQALENAALNGEDDIIILEAGTYKTTDDSVGTFTFSDTEAHELTIKAKDGLAAKDVILYGANTHQALNLTNTQAATFVLDRVTVQNGKGAPSGGGIYTINDLIVTNAVISGNTADHGGGIIGSVITVTNSTISGNTGGGINGSTITITASTITNNSSYLYGGGIYSSGPVTVTHSTVSKNTTTNPNAYGGGIYSNGAVTINKSTISDNIADGFSLGSYAHGGGIYGATVTVINSTISGNAAKGLYGHGGGIYGAIVTAANSVISGNTATYGGGTHITGTATVINSTIADNTANSYGGGVFGGGTFINNIFYNNSSDIYFGRNSNLNSNYIDYTKLQNESIYTIVRKNNTQPSSGSLNFADSSYRLGTGSVAIDKGLDPDSVTFKNLCSNTTVADALKTDKDGSARSVGDAVDLGAYEYGGATVINRCEATVSSNLDLHIPIVTVSGSNYSNELQYNSASSTWDLKEGSKVSDMSPYINCEASTLSSGGTLYIPVLMFNNFSYWVYLQHNGSAYAIAGGGTN